METPQYVLQATYFKEYTPSSGLVPFEFMTFFLDTDSTVSFVDKEGNASTLVSFTKGYHPILVSKIVTVTSGKVYLMKHIQVSK